MAALRRILLGTIVKVSSPTLCLTSRSLCGIALAPNKEKPMPVPDPVTCTLIPGDGVGPDLIKAVMEIFKAASVPVTFEEYFLSELQHDKSVPIDKVIESISKNGICLKGILATPEVSVTGDPLSLNMKLRRNLDTFAQVVHVKSLPGVKAPHQNVDIIVVREQTEGEYSALEHECVKGVVECLKIITRRKSERIAKFAFDYATKTRRKMVTAIHKANIMKLGDGLFLKSCEEISQLYPKIKFNAMIVDNCTMQLVSHPNQFDVLVLPNLYGSIVNNIAAGLVGGAGLVAGSSYSADCVIFEPGARHIYAEAAGKNLANPTAMMLCACNMLSHVNLGCHSEMIRKSIENVLSEGKVKTRDLGGKASSIEFTDAVLEKLKC